MKITVVGAGAVGASCAEYIAIKNFVSEVVLLDIKEGFAEGKAMDLMQTASLNNFDTNIIGSTNDYSKTSNSNICVITSGIPRKPGMSRMDLLEVNAKIVQGVTEEILKYSDNPSIVVVTNPLDQMTTLASDVSGLSKNKVMGQAGILDSSRFAYFIAEKLSVKTSDVYALTLGSHGETMVPVPSLCTVKGEPLTNILSESDINELVEKTSNGGAEIVGLLKTGSAYFAPASSAAVMVKSIVNNSDEIFPVCAWLDGQYGIKDVYLGVPAKLGKDGVTEVVEFELTETEKDALINASNAVKTKVEELNNIKNQ